MRLKKVKSSAMQFAILVSSIVALLLAAFLTLTYTQFFFKAQSAFLRTAIFNSNQAFFNSTGSVPSPDFTIADNEKLLKIRSFWGGYVKMGVEGTVKTKKFSKKALLGQKRQQPQTGIYMTDISSPLVVIGETEIEGVCYVSDKGIIPGNISGNYFYGKLPPAQNIRTTTGTLPELDMEWSSYITDMLNNPPALNSSVVEPEELNTNSFFESSPVFYYTKDAWVVTGAFIGNVILKSEKEIVISKNAHLTDVMVVAPKISIEPGFSGNAHFVASERLQVKENVFLAYPSSLVVNAKEKKESGNTVAPPLLTIAQNTRVEGNVIFIDQHTEEYHTDTNLHIETGAVVEGEVYCEGNIEFSGSVIGSLYTKRFVVNKFGSVYMNHIFNGSVYGGDLHEKFAGLPFANEPENVARWLY